MIHVRLLLILACSFLLSLSVRAQVSQPAVSVEPKTKLETFQAKTGAVIVKGFSTVGTMRGTGTVEVSAREHINALNNTRQYGIVIEVKEGGRLERESRSFVDYEEIDSLIKGIDYISKADASISKLSEFEAEYKTLGDLSITVFSTNDGSLSLAVSVGRIGRTSAYFKLSDLARFRELIVGSKTKLDSIR